MAKRQPDHFSAARRPADAGGDTENPGKKGVNPNQHGRLIVPGINVLNAAIHNLFSGGQVKGLIRLQKLGMKRWNPECESEHQENCQ
jgi:hypothetical protein